MPTVPIEEFIPRQIDNLNIDEILIHCSSLIEEVVNYGSHVFRWSIDNITGRDENAPVLLMYRHMFELIDSISVLIKNSCTEPCHILLRSLFESFLHFNYLLEKDMKIRGIDFLVWHRHSEIENLKRFDPDEEAYAKYDEKKTSDIILKDIPRKPIPDIKDRIEERKKLFNLPSYKDSCAEYERTKAAKKGRALKNWHSMRNGPDSLYRLADDLGFPAQYEILYRSWSALVHGTDILEDKLSVEESGRVAFSQLRFPGECPFVTFMTITFGLSAIRLLAAQYVPERAADNAKWYISEIRDAYQALNNIKIIAK